jgi:hypothetical protein
MIKKELSNIEKQIEAIKQEILEIGEMRPGSLSLQYKNPKEKTVSFYQLSYTYKMKSKTEYIRPQFVYEIKRQIENYKKFKKLTEKWIDLAIEFSKNKMDIVKRKELK